MPFRRGIFYPRNRNDHYECEGCGNCACECGCAYDADGTQSTPNPEQTMRETNKLELPARRRACGNCGRLGHLTRTCTAPKKAHDKIGVEVEGWWRDLDATRRVADNWHMSGSEDGSLAYDRTNETVAYEFRTRPGSLGEAISQVTAIYPDKCDPSAGMHVHMSFHDPADISCLASREFANYFRERWVVWGRAKGVHERSDFWSRLRGENDDYCAINSDDDLRRPMGGSRYRQLNFQSYTRHQTMEMRMLPLFRDARLAVSALEEWVSIVEDFLRDRADTYLAKFDRAVALAPDETAVAVTRESAVVIAATPVAREMTLVLDHVRSRRGDLPAVRNIITEIEPNFAIGGSARTLTRDVAISPTDPVLPGHVRLFGGERTILNHVRRQLRAQGA